MAENLIYVNQLTISSFTPGKYTPKLPQTSELTPKVPQLLGLTLLGSLLSLIGIKHR